MCTTRKACAKRRIKVRKVSILLLPYSVTLHSSLHSSASPHHLFFLENAAKSRQLCPTLCDPIDSSPPGSCPCNSPGKNTGVGCHFLLQCMKVKSESEVAQWSPTLRDPMDLPGSSTHGIFQARVLEWGAIAFSSLEYNNFLNPCLYS